MSLLTDSTVTVRVWLSIPLTLTDISLRLPHYRN